MINKLKRITSSPHGPYKLGYSCATIVIDKVKQYQYLKNGANHKNITLVRINDCNSSL